MCEPTTIAMAATVAGGGLNAIAQHQQGQVAKQVGRNNEIMAEWAAQDALRRGDLEANKVRRQADQLKGAQRAKMAAAGVDLAAGTAAEIQDQTDFFSEVDQATARYNAKTEAWSLRERGRQAKAEGRAAARQANLQAFGTLLGTGGSVAGKWYPKG